jgi:hypothetical protein
MSDIMMTLRTYWVILHMLSILSQKHGSPIGCIPQPTTIAPSSNWVDSSKSTRVGRVKIAICGVYATRRFTERQK